MKTKQLLLAVIMVISAMASTTGCKKETPIKPNQHQNATMTIDTSQNLGGHDHPTVPPK